MRWVVLEDGARLVALVSSSRLWSLSGEIFQISFISSGQAARGSSVVSSKGFPLPSVWRVAVVGLGLFSEVRSRALCSGLELGFCFPPVVSGGLRGGFRG